MKNIILSVIFVIISVAAKSQSFTALDPNIIGTFNTNTNGNVNWGDYDNDGDMDVLISGQISQGPNVWRTAIYRNDDGKFTDLDLSIIPTRIGSNNWIDFDNDNDLDFFYIGYTTSENGKDGVFANAFLYENLGNDNFVQASNIFIPLYYSSSEWGDFNNDGYYDLIISGTQGSNDYTKVYFNFEGSLEDSGIDLPAYVDGSIDLGDYDNDGDTDILISGYLDGGSARRIHVYENSEGTFSNINAGLPNVNIGDAKWGDFNNDGLLDIALSGFKTGGVITEVYENLGNDQFEKLDTNISGMEVGELEWGDMDGNGYADLIITGGTSYYGGRFGHIYLNDGNGGFTLSDFEFTAMGFSSLDLGDFDGDNDLDIIISGATDYNAGQYLTQVYRNELTTLEQPVLPTELESIQTNNLISLSWTNENPDSLTNNLFIHELNAATYLKNPMADTATGFSLLPKQGNQFFQSSLDIDLPIGRYVWGVQAVNATLVGSSFSKDTLNVKPTPDFDLSATGCVNEVISITYTGDSSLVASNEFIWDFGSPAQVLGSGSGPYEVMYSSAGEYDIKIVVVSNGVKSDTIVKLVTVYSPPESSFTAPSSVCSGDESNITYDGNATELATFNWGFDGGTIKSGEGAGPYEISWDSFGEKTITLLVSENGCAKRSETIIEVIRTPTADLSVNPVLCEGETATISYNGNGTELATYNWDFDGGTVTSGEGAGPYEISWDSFGEKTISLSVTENGCSSESFVQQINYSQYPSLSFTANESTCYNQDYSITFTGSNYTDLNWSFDGANIISGSDAGPYKLNWNSSGTKFIDLIASNNGCSKDTTIILEIPDQPFTPDICLVTVDEASSKNMLIWEYDLESVSQFGIYRESNVSGEYTLVEFVEGGLSNTYIDNQSSPSQQSNRYKITSLDSCGTETDLSNYHKTIHLTINKGIGNTWNLIWDGYEGFSFGTYRIYRSLNGNSFDLLTEIASNLTSYSDTDVKTIDIAYQIEVVSPNSCGTSESGRLLQTATSRSNIARSSTALGTTSINDQIEIFPNPTSDYLNIESSSDQFESYELISLTGQVLQVGGLTGKDILSLEGIPSGVYLLSVNTTEGRINERIVKK